MDITTILLALWTLFHTTATFAIGNAMAPDDVGPFKYLFQVVLCSALNFAFFFQADQHLIYHHVLGPVQWGFGYIAPIFTTATVDCDLWLNEIDKIKRLPLAQYLEERRCNGVFEGLSAQSQGDRRNQLLVSMALVVLGTTMATFLCRETLSQFMHTASTLSKAFRATLTNRQDRARLHLYRTAVSIHLDTISTQATRITKLQEECKELKNLIEETGESRAGKTNEQVLRYTAEEFSAILEDAKDTAVQNAIASHKEQAEKEKTQMRNRSAEVCNELQEQHAIEKQALRTHLEENAREEKENSRKKLERQFDEALRTRVETELQTRFESEIEESRQKSLATKNALAKAEEETKSSQNQLVEKELELARVTKDLEETNAELTEAKKHATQDQNQLALIRTQLAEANTLVAKNKALVSTKETALTNAEGQTSSFRTKLAEKEGELARVTKQLADANSLVVEKNDQLLASENDLASVKDQEASTAAHLKGQVEELARAKEKLKTLAAKKKKEQSAKDAALEKSKEETARAQTQLKETKEELLSVKAEAENLSQKEIELTDAKTQATKKQNEFAGLKNLLAQIEQACQEAFVQVYGQTDSLQIPILEFIQNVTNDILYHRGRDAHFSKQYEQEKAQHEQFEALYNSASKNTDNDSELKNKFNVLLELHNCESQMLDQQASLLEKCFKELNIVFQQCFVLPEIKSLNQSHMVSKIKELQNQWILLSQPQTLESQQDVEMTQMIHQASSSSELEHPPAPEAKSQGDIEMEQQPLVQQAISQDVDISDPCPEVAGPTLAAGSLETQNTPDTLHPPAPETEAQDLQMSTLSSPAFTASAIEIQNTSENSHPPAPKLQAQGDLQMPTSSSPTSTANSLETDNNQEISHPPTSETQAQGDLQMPTSSIPVFTAASQTSKATPEAPKAKRKEELEYYTSQSSPKPITSIQMPNIATAQAPSTEESNIGGRRILPLPRRRLQTSTPTDEQLFAAYKAFQPPQPLSSVKPTAQKSPVQSQTTPAQTQKIVQTKPASVSQASAPSKLQSDSRTSFISNILADISSAEPFTTLELPKLPKGPVSLPTPSAKVAPAGSSLPSVPKPQPTVDMTEYNRLMAKVMSQEKIIADKCLDFPETWEQIYTQLSWVATDEDRILHVLPRLKNHSNRMNKVLKK